MKTAGDILSALFDERFVKKAQGYSKLFDSWTDITAKNGIAAAADHSRIKDLDRGILLIEMDHPGWKQIIQTKQSKLLNDYRIRFPELGITGISLMLSSGKQQAEKTAEIFESKMETDQLFVNEERQYNTSKDQAIGLEAIKDGDFKESLKKLGQTIAERKKGKK
ncbi:MAG: DUF721 domain-containing protein [Treponema sp.]|nr:DUF721 domain-containing protein [Treponema sp.]